MKTIFFKPKSLNPRLIKNRFLLNCDYLKKSITVSGYPTELTIELTNYCNLDCIFCPRRKMKRPLGFIDFELFKSIINQVKGHSELIDLDLMGEPVLHPKIFDMITYCKKSGLTTLLHSNMSATNMKLSRELAFAGLDILVMSIDAATKQTYEFLRKGAHFETTKQNIEFMLGLDSKGLFKVVQMIYNNINKHESDAFLKMWKNKGAQYLRLSPYENLDKQLIEFNAIPPDRGRDNRKPCVQIWRKFAVYWDGTAVACCSDYDNFLVIGDLKNSSITDIWNGERMVSLRQKHVTANLNTVLHCKECRFFKAGLLLIIGSTFVDSYAMRRLLFIFEKLLIKKNIPFFRYF